MAGAGITRLVVLLSVFSTLFLSSSAQTCNSYSFSGNQAFTNCMDLPVLSSFLHWNYVQSTGKLQMAYRHTAVSSNTWVSWAINPNSLSSAMPGAQALVAVPQSGGAPKVYTSPIQGYQTSLAEGNLSYEVTGLTASYQNNEMIIFATWSLPTTTTKINQVWQAGPVSGTTLGAHSTTNSANLNSKSALDLVSGQSQSGGGSSSNLRKRNVHGVLNAVSWGILMPTGAIIARYLKVFKSADPAWFYLHVTCQTSAYIVGVAGWGTGLKLGSDSVGITRNPHRNIGIALFCLGTLQVFALLLRPKKDHKFRLYWNIYHHSIGYAVIILSIINIYEGFEILQKDDWKKAYTGVIIALGAIAISLEAYTWYYVLKIKRSENKVPYGANGNGANGYGSSAV
ncbi:Cytochrome b561 and DOMON domain-containing protein [Trema orientale]|uniref:Cytochrome b561 and DOMON domain-containing protein n=1 Tax=Trema orientale TaxID=63057 RepID=A0A2P5EXH2_TREOI|nr:Cytochrome b561 and DOMON domain-containing protein [Trema orientale]